MTLPPTTTQGCIYIHWPFCVSKCPYCDFNSHVRASIDQKAWQEAYLKDLKAQHAAHAKNWTITSVFFGGGTPSLMDPSLVSEILKTIKSLWPVAPELEVTLEANPQSVEIEKFKDFYQAGINRLSLGIQSFRAEALSFLGRAHDVSQAERALEVAHQVFPRFSFDLIYAHPKHTPEMWKEELKEALNKAGGHLSLYHLTIEPQTPFEGYVRQGRFQMPTTATSERFFDITNETAEAQGYPAYEISNYAKSGHECLHNLTYWRYRDYMGVGPGAHGRLTKKGMKYATRAHRSPEIWLQRIQEKGEAFTHFDPLTPQERVQECVLMGLRLKEGIELERLNLLSASENFWEEVGPIKQKALVAAGYMTQDTTRVQLTDAGLKRLNQVYSYLLG